MCFIYMWILHDFNKHYLNEWVLKFCNICLCPLYTHAWMMPVGMQSFRVYNIMDSLSYIYAWYQRVCSPWGWLDMHTLTCYVTILQCLCISVHSSCVFVCACVHACAYVRVCVIAWHKWPSRRTRNIFLIVLGLTVVYFFVIVHKYLQTCLDHGYVCSLHHQFKPAKIPLI